MNNNTIRFRRNPGPGPAGRRAGLLLLLAGLLLAQVVPAAATTLVPAPAAPAEAVDGPQGGPGLLAPPVAVAAPVAPSADAEGVPLLEQYREGGGTGYQSSMTHVVLFYVGAFFAVLGAIVVILARRPMRSALGLLIAVLATAGLYLLLRAELLAALQVLIYAGAVVVLLVFVITFLEQGAIAAPGGRWLPVRILSVAAVGYALYLIGHELFALGLGTRLVPPPGFGTTAGLGDELFTTFLVPFEAISALLLTAIVGAVTVAKGRTDGTPATTHPAGADERGGGA